MCRGIPASIAPRRSSNPASAKWSPTRPISPSANGVPNSRSPRKCSRRLASTYARFRGCRICRSENDARAASHPRCSESRSTQDRLSKAKPIADRGTRRAATMGLPSAQPIPQIGFTELAGSVLLAEGVVAGLGRGLPRGWRAAFLLLVPLGFRLLLFLVAFHLTFRHGVRPWVGLAAEEPNIARFRCTLMVLR